MGGEMTLISSLQNPLVKHLVRLRQEGDYRMEHRLIVLEGVKPIQEANGIIQLFYTAPYVSQTSFFNGEEFEITDQVLRKISGMNSPEGIAAVVKMPASISLDKQRYVVALDGINDPGNMGTLLRTALAFGWEAVYFLPGGCDPFNEKVLRAARGAHFKLPFASGTAEDLQRWCEKNGVEPLVADLKGKSPNQRVDRESCLLVVGNEAHGPSAKILSFCKAVTIPMPGEMESLNVAIAGGILLYLLSGVNR
jgi:TrmH family RNA methyltransferase